MQLSALVHIILKHGLFNLRLYLENLLDEIFVVGILVFDDHDFALHFVPVVEKDLHFGVSAEYLVLNLVLNKGNLLIIISNFTLNSFDLKVL